MREFFRDYGAAIGPTLAFAVAVAMLKTWVICERWSTVFS